MKIIVVHENQSQEIVTLTEPLKIVRGGSLNRLVTATGMEHFFTEAGYYDGFGRAVSEPVTEEQAAALIDALDSEREFPQ